MSDDISAQVKSILSNNAKLVYILYLVGLVVGVTSIIGVVVAYINKNDAPAWLKSHYDFQIGTFWIGLLGFFIGILLIPVVIGFLVLLALLIWWIIRNVKGIRALDKAQAIADPKTWLF